MVAADAGRRTGLSEDRAGSMASGVLDAVTQHRCADPDIPRQLDPRTVRMQDVQVGARRPSGLE